MNVLRTEFTSKQKRRRGQPRTMAAFFSDYRTVGDVLNLPGSSSANQEKQTERPFHLSPKFSSEVSQFEEPGESEHETMEVSKVDSKITDNQKHRENSGSTSLEFQQLLAPFQIFRQEFPTKDLEESYMSDQNLFKNLDKSSVFKDTEEECNDSCFKIPQDSTSGSTKKQASSDLCFNHQSLPSSNLEILEQLNVLSLSAVTGKSENSTKRTNAEGSTNQNETHNCVHIPEKYLRTPSEKKMRTISSVDSKTPRTPNSSKITADSDTRAFILAVTEGRGQARGEVGIAAMDPKRPHLILCQISDSQRYVHTLTKMNVFDFAEVIVPNTFVDRSAPTKLYSDIRSRFPTVTLTSVQRRHFNEAGGIDLVKQYGSPESGSVALFLRDKFYALSAAAALIKYIEFTQNVRLAPRSLRIEYQGTEDAALIGNQDFLPTQKAAHFVLRVPCDSHNLIVIDRKIFWSDTNLDDLDTANHLELVMCANHPETNSNHSLISVVKHCHTKGGVRLLRANILQPPCSLDKIESRLNCVTELVNNPLLLCALESAVASFANVESLLNLCMHAPQQEGLRVAEHQLKYTLLLKTVLELLPVLRASLQEAKSEFFNRVRENLEDVRYSIILDRILQVVFENAKTVKGSVAAHLHGCFAIKAGINSLLDLAKKTYCEIVQEISDHVAKLRETYDMSLRISFSANKGFHIQFTPPPGQRGLKKEDLPREFILAQKSRSTWSFYTTELVALDRRSQRVLNEIKVMTNAILFDLLTDVREHVGCLFNLCEFVAELDVLLSFARVGSGTNYVRPNFANELLLKDSRHPILDVVHDGEVVPNDVSARPEKNFIILTGPNQSGKSIYIRQIALLQVMAQIGCYVPAKKATFRLTDRIFSRIAFDDSIESNASTLMVEMRDVEYLRQNVTERSLVIIDELCRGTSVDEGTSVAFAICEQLLDSSAFVFFTTHFLFLTKLEQMYYNVANYHFETRLESSTNETPDLVFTHKRREGVTTDELYGLQVARMTSFPKDVCLNAKTIADNLMKELKERKSVGGMLEWYKLSLELKNELLKCGPEVDWPKLEPVIRSFKQQYLNCPDLEEVYGEVEVSCRVLHTEVEKLEEKQNGSQTSSKIEAVVENFQAVVKPTRWKRKTANDKSLAIKLAKKIKRKYRKLRSRNTLKGQL